MKMDLCNEIRCRITKACPHMSAVSSSKVRSSGGCYSIMDQRLGINWRCRLKHGAQHVNQHRRNHCRLVARGEPRSSNRTKWANEPGTPGNVGREVACDVEDIRQLIWEEAEGLQAQFLQIDKLIHSNSGKVQQAFKNARVGPHHFAGSTGYGHGDLGRRALDEAVAEVMGTESAIVRTQFVSGTHAIACALYGVLRPGDTMLAVAGRPYDTLEEVIGLRGDGDSGSLASWGVKYKEVPLLKDGSVDLSRVHRVVSTGTIKAALVQRSCGYALRPTLTVSDIAEIVEVIKQADASCLVLVDNCYGEFTEVHEPGSVSVDLMMGSLIKNPGGTIAAGGGYVAGRSSLVELAGSRLGAPGVGIDAGCVSGESLRLMMQGLFLAPQMVGESLKAGRLIASVLAKEGYGVVPTPGDQDPSFITAVRLGSKQKMVQFCNTVQQHSPVGSYVQPIPGVTPGYEDEVIFADGTFIDGSTSELSADGPIRFPYVVYCQGGTHWTHWARILESVVHALRHSR